MIDHIRFVVPGIPAPQGSKAPWGSEANPATKPWRAAVTAAAAEAMGGLPLIDEPVTLHVTFRFPRPKGHFGKKGLKASAPDVKASKPDLDKLLRAIGDSLTGVLLRDDAQIVRLTASKVYGEPARAEIEITRVEDERLAA